MLIAALLTVAIQDSIQPGRFEMAERFRQLDVAWLTTPNKSKRTDAVPKITTAISSFFLNRAVDACRHLDEATAALEGRSLRPEDALSFRFQPPVVEPGETAHLIVSWAYPADSAIPIQVVAGTRVGTIEPGKTLTLDLDTPGLNPESARDPEAGILVPIQAGEVRESAFLSIIKSFTKRLEGLRSSKNAVARDLAEAIDLALKRESELDVPLIQYLFMGEQIASGQKQISDFEQVPYAKSGQTVLRAAIPKGVKSEATVVIAIHGAGGSENMFFEVFGRGMAMQEAMKRGWVFISPRASGTCVQDSLDWLRNVRGLKPDRLFMIGHSMGALFAVGTGKLTPKPAAVALFAPAVTNVPQDLDGVPIFMAVGKQETTMMRSFVDKLQKELRSRRGSVLKEYDPAEHLMVVPNGTKDAFTFFDQVRRP